MTTMTIPTSSFVKKKQMTSHWNIVTSKESNNIPSENAMLLK